MKCELLLNHAAYIPFLEELLLKGSSKAWLTADEKVFLKTIFQELNVRLEFTTGCTMVGFQYNYQRNALKQYISSLVKFQDTGCFTFSVSVTNDQEKNKDLLIETFKYFNVKYKLEFPSIYLME